MKKVFSIFALVLVVSVSATSIAEQIPMINGSGEVVLMDQPENWYPLTNEQKMAMDNPGQEVPVGDYNTTYEKIDFWHVAKVKTYHEVAVYNNGKIQTIAKDVVEKSNPQLSLYKVFCLISILCMVVFNTIYIKYDLNENITAADTAAVAAAAFTALTALAAAFTAFTALAVVAVVVAATADSNPKAVKYASLVFYILMTIVFFI